MSKIEGMFCSSVSMARGETRRSRVFMVRVRPWAVSMI